MKTTKERLAESWCRPKTDEEWTLLLSYVPSPDNTICAWADDFGLIEHENTLDWMTEEIPVPHFIDLFHDKIARWRLEEDGFEQICKPTCVTHHLTLSDGAIVQVTSGRDVSVIEKNEFKGDDHILFQGVRTYTDLITLIRLIG
jgi:hypothetical protein